MNVLFFVHRDFLKIQWCWWKRCWIRSHGLTKMYREIEPVWMRKEWFSLPQFSWVERYSQAVKSARRNTFTCLIFFTLLLALCLLPSKYYLVWKIIVFFHTFTQSVIATEKVDNYFIQVTLYLKTIKGC